MSDEIHPTEAPAGEEGAAPADLQAQALAAAEAKAEEHYANYVRVLAESDNFRKRAARELDLARQFAVERFAQELLPAMDGFELAIANGAASDVQSLIEGQGATLRLLQKAFEKAGIREIAPETGSAFNPEEHEAMVAQPSMPDMATSHSTHATLSLCCFSNSTASAPLFAANGSYPNCWSVRTHRPSTNGSSSTASTVAEPCGVEIFGGSSGARHAPFSHKGR